MFHKQVAVLEQIFFLLCETFVLACGPFGLFATRTATSTFGLPGLQLPSRMGQCLQHLLIDFLQYMELTDLMIYLAKHRLDRLRIQRGTIGRNPLDAQVTDIQMLLEPPKELLDVFVLGIMVQDVIVQPPEVMVVYNK